MERLLWIRPPGRQFKSYFSTTLIASHVKLWRTINQPHQGVTPQCWRQASSPVFRGLQRETGRRLTIPPAPPIFKPQPLSVGVFSYVLPPDPANTRGTLSRFADFDSRACCPPLATWRSLRAIPLSFLSASKLPEVRRRYACDLCKSMACALIDQTVVFWHR